MHETPLTCMMENDRKLKMWIADDATGAGNATGSRVNYYIIIIKNRWRMVLGCCLIKWPVNVFFQN